MNPDCRLKGAQRWRYACRYNSYIYIYMGDTIRSTKWKLEIKKSEEN